MKKITFRNNKNHLIQFPADATLQDLVDAGCINIRCSGYNDPLENGWWRADKPDSSPSDPDPLSPPSADNKTVSSATGEAGKGIL